MLTLLVRSWMTWQTVVGEHGFAGWAGSLWLSAVAEFSCLSRSKRFLTRSMATAHGLYLAGAVAARIEEVTTASFPQCVPFFSTCRQPRGSEARRRLPA